MIDLLLINPSLELERVRDNNFRFGWLDGGHGWVPQFAIYLLPYIQSRGFSSKFIDLELYSSDNEWGILEQYISSSRFIGFSVMSAQIPHALRLTDMIKQKFPSKKIIWGGVHGSLLPAQTIEYENIDYVIVGEGEKPLENLLKGLDHPRIINREKKIDENLVYDFLKPEELFSPDYSFLEMDKYFTFQGPQYRQVDLLASRGCPYRCTFCVNTIFGNKWRGLSLERLEKVIDELYNKYSIRHIFLMDENLFGNIKWAESVIDIVSKYNFTWEANIHIKDLIKLSDYFMYKIKKSGALRLRMGAESGSDRLLKILKKNITSEQIKAARDKCLDAGITPVLSFMTNLPDELLDEKLATRLLLKKSRVLGASVIGPQTFRPYPGSAEFDKLVNRGLKIPQNLIEWSKSDLFNTCDELHDENTQSRLSELIQYTIERENSYLVTIKNIGKSQMSKAEQVWLLDGFSENVYINKDIVIRQDAGWQAQTNNNGELFWYSDLHNSELVFVFSGAELNLKFLKSSWSSQVSIGINGLEIKRIDLFSDENIEVELPIKIPEKCFTENNILNRIYSLLELNLENEALFLIEALFKHGIISQELLTLKAEIYLRLENYEAAWVSLLHGVEKYPNNLNLLNNYAVLLMMDFNYKDASGVLSRVLRIDEHNEVALDNLAYLKTNWNELSPKSKTEELETLIRNLHGMTTFEERIFLYKYTKENYTHSGKIVDLGAWLGSLTIPLLIALNPDNQLYDQNLVYAYDLFKWQDWMEPYQTANYKVGDSFLDEFERHVKPFRGNILKIESGDLCLKKWNEYPIELLVVDAMKSWELTNHILKTFYPYLIPGKSYVFHQDFAHYYTPWIHLVHYRLKDYFVPIYDVEDSATVVFLNIKKIPNTILNYTFGFSDFNDEEIDKVFNYSLTTTSQDFKIGKILAAKVMTYYHQNKIEYASKVFNEIVTQNYEIKEDLKEVQDLLTHKDGILS